MLVVARIRLSWRCVAVVALLLAGTAVIVLVAPSRVRVRAAAGGVPQNVRGQLELECFFPGVEEVQITVTKIAELEGSLWQWTSVAAELVSIRSGIVQPDGCGTVLGTNSSRLDNQFFRYSMHPHIVLARADTKRGGLVTLASYGAPAGGSKGPLEWRSVCARVIRSYDRMLGWSKKEIIYVEGDNEPMVHPGMSLSEFCDKNNKGEYLVVIASLE
jgi:hypothetical protein